MQPQTESFESMAGAVRHVANKYKSATKHLPIEYGDLVSACHIGLARAYKDYDPAKAKWSTFAFSCMNGACLDLVRRIKFQLGETRTSYRAKVRPRLEMFSFELKEGIESDWYQMSGYETDDDILQRLEDDANIARVSAAIATLPERWRQVILMKLDNLSNAEIGKKLSLCESRIYQIYYRAIEELAAIVEMDERLAA